MGATGPFGLPFMGDADNSRTPRALRNGTNLPRTQQARIPSGFQRDLRTHPSLDAHAEVNRERTQWGQEPCDFSHSPDWPPRDFFLQEFYCAEYGPHAHLGCLTQDWVHLNLSLEYESSTGVSTASSVDSKDPYRVELCRSPTPKEDRPRSGRYGFKRTELCSGKVSVYDPCSKKIVRPDIRGCMAYPASWQTAGNLSRPANMERKSPGDVSVQDAAQIRELRESLQRSPEPMYPSTTESDWEKLRDDIDRTVSNWQDGD